MITHKIRHNFLSLTAALIFSPILNAQAAPPPPADAAHSGWLEGTVLTTEGKALSARAYLVGGVHVHAVRQGGGEVDAATDTDMGGLYTAQNIRPGIYTVTVPKSYIGGTPYSPQRIFSVIVKPGVRTVLNITTDPGENLVETGHPIVATDRITSITAEIASLRQQIADLKKQFDALQEQTNSSVRSTP